MSVAECALDSGVDLSILLRGPPRLICRLSSDYYASITKMGGEALIEAGVRLSVFPMPLAQKVRFRFSETYQSVWPHVYDKWPKRPWGRETCVVSISNSDH